ncbi:MAG: winged helix-turn-helix domain-containing protein [Niveispirillum sp.]|uniref:winged helix-turn-helix domain-containing protein n=1 Tax=Niveispirillum sp. TaxID=1917217 RepID=UPI003BA6A235
MSLSGTTLAASAPPQGSAGSSPLSPLVRGNLHLRFDTGRALWRGRQVTVTGTELKMLHLLVRTPGTAVGYRALYDLVHGPGFMAGKGNAGYRANVRAFIKRIRRKFREVDDGFDAIGNDPGTGYIWRD